LKIPKLPNFAWNAVPMDGLMNTRKIWQDCRIEYIFARESRIDVVVNNAGFGIVGALEDTFIKEAKSQFESILPVIFI
jgi:NAD(P)-dependent dehydrogenase (short-subunit alcohol dehydrogenase family)